MFTRGRRSPSSSDGVRYTALTCEEEPIGTSSTLATSAGLPPLQQSSSSLYGPNNELYASTGMDYRSIYTYTKYNDLDEVDRCLRKRSRRLRKGFSTYTEKDSSKLQRNIIETTVIIFCHLILVITLPFSLLLCVKFVQTFERLVVLRLGRLQNARGPGATLVLPCIDSWRRVDLRTKAFNVPPLQAITQDGGVVELGATVYYRIKDALAVVVSVQDWNASTRTLAHTTLLRHLNKVNVEDFMQDKRTLTTALLTELNKCTFTWGMEITEVELSEVKVLKDGNNQAVAALQSLMKPQIAGQLMQQMGGQMPASAGSRMEEIAQTLHHALSEHQQQNPGTLLPSSTSAPMIVGANGYSNLAMQNDPPALQRQALMAFDSPNGSAPRSASSDGHLCHGETLKLDLEKMVWTIGAVLNEELVKQIGYVYQVDCREMGQFYMDLKHGSGQISMGLCPEGLGPDVTFTMTGDDLLLLFLGTLSPLDAYLSGKIDLKGDTSAAMKLKVLANYMTVAFKGSTTN